MSKGKVVNIMHDCRRRITEALREVADATDKLAEAEADYAKILANIQRDASAAAKELVNLSIRRMRRAMTGRTPHPSSVPYGFRVKNGEVSEHPKEMPVLVTILRMRMESKSLRWIANDMNGSGAPARKGGRWSSQVVKDICDRADIKKGGNR